MAKQTVYDVLHTLPTGDQLTFEVVPVATAVEVPLADGTPLAPFVPLANANGDQLFEPGENFILEFVSINIPYGFGQGTGLHRLSLVWKPTGGGTVVIPELAGNSALDMPNLCDGIVFPGGLFIEAPKDDSAVLGLVLADLNVSMINAPSSLIGETILATYFFGISHTRPLGVAP